MSKYLVTITVEGWSDDPVVQHQEKFDNYGSMNLWAKQWFKTLGTYRTPYKDDKRHKIYPKDYQQHKVSLSWGMLNWSGEDNFQDYTEANFLEGYYNAIDSAIGGLFPEEKLLDYGISLGCVQVQKKAYRCYTFYVKKLKDEWV